MPTFATNRQASAKAGLLLKSKQFQAKGTKREVEKKAQWAEKKTDLEKQKPKKIESITVKPSEPPLKGQTPDVPMDVTNMSQEERDRIAEENYWRSDERFKAREDKVRQEERDKLVEEEIKRVEEENKLPPKPIDKNEVMETPKPVWNADFVKQAYSKENLKESGKDVLQAAATVYDTIHSAISRRRGMKTEATIAQFTDASTSLNTNTKLVASGDLPYELAIKDLDRAESALLALKETAKAEGQFNARYWVTKGQEIEEEINREETALEAHRVALENARRKAIVQQAKENLGMTNEPS